MRPDIYGILGSFGIFTRNLNIALLFQTKRGCCAWVCTGSSTGGSVGLRIWIFCSLPAKPCRSAAGTFNQIFNMLRGEVEHFVPARIFGDCHCWRMAACNTKLSYVVLISCIDPQLFSPPFCLSTARSTPLKEHTLCAICAMGLFCWQHQSENRLSGASCFTGWAIYCWHLK